MHELFSESPPAGRPSMERGLRDGVAVVAVPDRIEDLSVTLDEHFVDPSVAAVVLVFDAPRLFCDDRAEVQALRFASDAEEAARKLAYRVERIASAPKPVVACLRSSALGPVFEVALACANIVMARGPKIRVALPAVEVGLIPRAQGLLRVAERAGVTGAIDLGLSGRALGPDEALAVGLVDRVVDPADAVESACARALELVSNAMPLHAPRSRLERARRALLEKTPFGRAWLFRRARAASFEKTRGHYPAPERMLELLERFARSGFARAADLEPRLFGELVVSETAHRLLELGASVEATEAARLPASPRPVRSIAIVQTDMLHAGVAAAVARSGIELTLVQVDGTSLALPSADVVLETLFGDLGAERAAIARLEAVVSPRCVIAAGTSAEVVSEIARGAQHPERIVGLRFASPPRSATLAEVVARPGIDPVAMATCIEVARRSGTTVVVVEDRPGFFVTRVEMAALGEALHLLAEGIPVARIDEAMRAWGFPAGPIARLDDLGLDVADATLCVLERTFGPRWRAPRLLHTLVLGRRLGRKNGRGFYDYPYGARRGPSPHVEAELGIRGAAHASAPPASEEIQLRCSLAAVNEALRCLDEGVVRSPRDGDVAATLGFGFPRFRGGPFRYVDVLGAPEILRRTRTLEQRFGARFEPAPLLVRTSRRGQRFYD